MKSRRAAAPLGGGALLALAVLAAGCGSDSETTGSAGGGDPRVVDVRLVDAGCQPAELTLPPGPTRFEVTNDGADAVTEFEILDGDRILREVENLAPGLYGEFSLTLTPGRYVLYCPGGTSAERGSLTVEGSESD